MPMEVLVALGVVVVLVALGLRVVPERQRIAVMRLGRYVGLRGPGVVFVLPFIDRAIRLNLDHDIPNWRALSEDELRESILELLNR